MLAILKIYEDESTQDDGPHLEFVCDDSSNRLVVWRKEESKAAEIHMNSKEILALRDWCNLVLNQDDDID